MQFKLATWENKLPKPRITFSMVQQNRILIKFGTVCKVAKESNVKICTYPVRVIGVGSRRVGEVEDGPSGASRPWTSFRDWRREHWPGATGCSQRWHSQVQHCTWSRCFAICEGQKGNHQISNQLTNLFLFFITNYKMQCNHNDWSSATAPRPTIDTPDPVLQTWLIITKNGHLER